MTIIPIRISNQNLPNYGLSRMSVRSDRPPSASRNDRDASLADRWDHGRMTSDFIPLSLKWRLVAGADLPGFRAAEANADGEWPMAGASPNVAEADSLMRAIAAGATEDELV